VVVLILINNSRRELDFSIWVGFVGYGVSLKKLLVVFGTSLVPNHLGGSFSVNAMLLL